MDSDQPDPSVVAALAKEIAVAHERAPALSRKQLQHAAKTMFGIHVPMLLILTAERCAATPTDAATYEESLIDSANHHGYWEPRGFASNSYPMPLSITRGKP